MLRMGASNSLEELKRTLSARWQVPLFGLSIVLLVLTFGRLRPPEPGPTFQQQLDQIAALQAGGFLSEANEMIQELLKAERLPKARRGALRRALAETIFLAEQPLRRHDPENAKRIIRNHRRALAEGLPRTATVHEQMGEAYRWINDTQRAVEQFGKAVAAGSERAGRLRRAIVELLRAGGGVSPKLVSNELAAMLAQADTDPADLLWAVTQQVNLLSGEDGFAEAGQLLERVQPRLERAGLGCHIQYLQARRNYLAGEFDQAERLLLDLRNKLELHEDLSARAGWLLGRVHLGEARPQEAMGCFQEVIRNHPSGEYALASRLGIAECLAVLRHIDESASAYEEVAGLSARYSDGEVVDRDAVRASLTSLYAMLRAEGRLEAAVRFLRLGAALVWSGDEAMTADYLRRLADLYVSLGQARMAQAQVGSQPASRPAGSEDPLADAHEAFLAAAETYLRLSRVTMSDVPRSSEAAWLAAVQFDRANLPDRMMAVLEDFLLAYPRSPKLPEALFRLGRAFQSLGRYQQAIGRYVEGQKRFPRAPASMRSLVPMARCYIALGPSSYPEAEKVLLTVVDQPTAMGRYDPEALEYREALFVLGDLYERWGKPARAITRLEEFLERYPQDPRIPRTQFTLANAYRKSGLALLAGQDGSGGPPGLDPAKSGAGRLRRAEALFAEVIRSLQAPPLDSLSPIERLHLKYSYLYQADCAFDQKQYDRARTLYEEAGRRFRKDPVSLSAYVQVLNCYQRLGRDTEAQATLQRIKWMLKSIPAERFEEVPGNLGLAYWRTFFDWVEITGLF